MQIAGNIDGHRGRLLPGFADPVHDAQRVFRAVLEAMSRPGTIVDVPGVLNEFPRDRRTAMAVLLALADADTPVWYGRHAGTPEIIDSVRFHTSAPVAKMAEGAVFALVDPVVDRESLDHLPIGEDEYPDRSATAIISVKSFGRGHGVRLRGPGINGEVVVSIDGPDEGFWQFVGRNHQRYPLGLDFILCSDGQIVGLPRSTDVRSL